MPEEGLETQDLKEQLEAARERAENAEKRGQSEERDGRWLTWLSLSTALLAALAAFASLEAGSLANEALLSKSEAVLAQSEYADNWAEYQARSIKAYLFGTQAALLTDAAKKEAESHAADERREAEKLKPLGAALKARIADKNEASARHLERHELFAKTVTLFQISIAVAAIAALTKKQRMWWLSLAGGLAGVVTLLLGLASGAGGGDKPAAAHAQAKTTTE
jgi:hypothetical protein